MLYNQMFKKSGKQNMKAVREIDTASSSQTLYSNDKENILLTEEEIREYFQLIEYEKTLDQELSNLKNEEAEFRSTQETMNLLHKYNDIKDVTQMVLGAIAVATNTTIKNLYKQYNLSLED
ncbi:DNA repair protein SWI5 homolog [Frieseomelitta varia]|uniref:DNA repair protein SWI5 homolog n=1 Tax=Frieseomelitta varia TaxID=561572 RepID=UPI001CB67E81|nr:DNA repair protein SWI5 homolog [Frieseomelitta varia]XP_043519990.1 DNA repair protein SWI5 homolog [Frieseomelitta varia]